MTKKSRNNRGQGLLESALVTLVFLVLLIGTLDVGQVLFLHQTLVERARNAVRYGAVHPFDADAIRNMVLYNQATVPGEQPEDDPVPGIFGLMPSMVAVTRQDASSNEDRITVSITSYPFHLFTPFIAGHFEGKPIVATIPYEGT